MDGACLGVERDWMCVLEACVASLGVRGGRKGVIGRVMGREAGAVAGEDMMHVVMHQAVCRAGTRIRRESILL